VDNIVGGGDSVGEVVGVMIWVVADAAGAGGEDVAVSA
jgi:hypothetical protein